MFLMILTVGLAAFQTQEVANKLRVYVAPVEYYNNAFSESPPPGYEYLFLTGERVSFDVVAVNTGPDPLLIRLERDAAIHLSLSRGLGEGPAEPLESRAWSVEGQPRIQDPAIGEYDVSSNFPVEVAPRGSVKWRVVLSPATLAGAAFFKFRADVQLACEPACAVIPHSPVFRFEVRNTIGRLERLERQYRQAMRAFHRSDQSLVENHLQVLEREYPASFRAALLRGDAAARSGRHRDALAAYERAAEALRSGSDQVAIARMGRLMVEDALAMLDSRIAYLKAQAR